MSTAPQNDARQDDNAPDYLPARMLNEFVYCARLFFYEHVEGVFAHNRETVEGALRQAYAQLTFRLLASLPTFGEPPPT